MLTLQNIMGKLAVPIGALRMHRTNVVRAQMKERTRLISAFLSIMCTAEELQ